MSELPSFVARIASLRTLYHRIDSVRIGVVGRKKYEDNAYLGDCEFVIRWWDTKRLWSSCLENLLWGRRTHYDDRLLNFVSAVADFMNSEFQFTVDDLQRINVVGTSSSGKSTFGRKLAESLEAPYIEMDSLYHEPNWTEAPLDVFRDRVSSVIEQPRWVLDGNYHSKTYDLKWSEATMIVWLDMPFHINMYRAVCRAVNRAWTQKELWPGTGNRETFRKTFLSSESMILWTATSFWRLKKRYGAVEKSPPSNVYFVRLRGPKAVKSFQNRVIEVLAADAGSR